MSNNLFYMCRIFFGSLNAGLVEMLIQVLVIVKKLPFVYSWDPVFRSRLFVLDGIISM